MPNGEMMTPGGQSGSTRGTEISLRSDFTSVEGESTSTSSS